MRNTCEPDSRFVERLEWQLSSEFRRLDRMKASKKIIIPRFVATITVTVGILLTGVAAMKAADYFKDSWRKKIEIARTETEVELKKVRLESIRELATRTKHLYSNGLIHEEEYLATKEGVEKAELALERSTLNLDEVKASGIPPRDDLYAPITGGRDFVSERLGNEIKSVEADLELLTNRWDRLNELVEGAVVSGEEMAMLQTEIESRKEAIDGILKRIDLRKRFLGGEITAREVELMDRMTIAEKNMISAQLRANSLKKQIERLEVLEAKGMISSMELRQQRYALDAAQAELKLANVEIDVLKKVK